MLHDKLNTIYLFVSSDKTKKSPNGYVGTAMELNTHRLNIVQPSVKSKSWSVTVNERGQNVSWQMCMNFH